MKFFRILSVIFCLTLIATPVFAQKKALEKADRAFELDQYNHAIMLYQKAFAKTKKNDIVNKNRILFQIGECYRKSAQYKKAITQYRRAIKGGYAEIEHSIYFSMAESLRFMGDYEGAQENYHAFLELEPNNMVAEQALASCSQSAEWIKNPTTYEVEVVKKLNTRDNDWGPRFKDPSCTQIVFTSTREGATGKKLDDWTGQRFSDLFMSSQDKKSDWSTPVLFDEKETINTKANEGEACFALDGNLMFYTFCGNAKKKQSGCKIYQSKYENDKWTDPEEVVLTVDSLADVVHANLSEDGLRLYFTSNMEGTHGDLDIWYAGRSDVNSEFGEAKNLGPTINTAGKEAFPFLRNDTLLYFSSTGHSGMGGYDIFKSVGENGNWGEPENVKYPLNSSGDDFGIIFYPGEDRGFFSSNRDEGRRGDEIYSFVNPQVDYTISGLIRNEMTLQYIDQVMVEMVGSDGSSFRMLTNTKGAYKFERSQIRPNTTYKIHISRQGFWDEEGTETTVGLTSSKDIIHDFSMKPVPKGPVKLPDILYDLGKWDLKTKYQDSLMGLIEILEKNPRIVIELASHTDYRRIAMGNDTLSQLRAQSVVDYLIARGIEPGRLVAKGYGAHVPLTIEKDLTFTANKKTFTLLAGTLLDSAFIATLKDKDEQEAIHQMNRRTEFSIIRDDYIPEDNNVKNPVVQISKVEDIKEIDFTTTPNGLPLFTTVVNGLSTSLAVDVSAKENLIAYEEAMKLLRTGRVNKNDFELKEKAFTEDGDILDKSIFRIREIKIEKYIIKNINVRVQKELEAPLILKKSDFDQVGSYTIDNANHKLILK